jgi:hypothetical protein
MNNHKISKAEYKFFLLFIRYYPIFLALLIFIKVVSRFLGVQDSYYYFVLDPSLFSVILMWYVSKIFKYCWVHRIPLYYIISIYFYDFLARTFWCESSVGCIYRFIVDIGITLVALLLYLLYYDTNNKKSSE